MGSTGTQQGAGGQGLGSVAPRRQSFQPGACGSSWAQQPPDALISSGMLVTKPFTSTCMPSGYCLCGGVVWWGGGWVGGCGGALGQWGTCRPACGDGPAPRCYACPSVTALAQTLCPA